MNSYLRLIRRLTPLFALYKEFLGWRGGVSLFLSGLTISLIQLFGLVLVFPFLKLVTDLDFHNHLLGLTTNTLLAPLLQDHKLAVLTSGSALLFLFVLNGWITARLVRFQANLAANLNSQISSQLITDALRSRFQLFLEHSPVKIGGMSYSHTMHVALLFQAIAAAFNELVLIALILFGLILASPLVSLALFGLVLFLALAFFRPMSRRVAKIGHHTQEIDLARHRFVFAMANAIRDIKIMGLERVFIKRNRDMAIKHAKLAADYSSITAVQRVAVEVILVGGVIVAAIWFAWRGGDLNQMAPTIATLGLVAIRSAPALSRLAGAYNSFRYSFPIVEGLLKLRGELNKYPQQRIPQVADFPGDYRGEGLCFSYGERQVLQDCTFNISQGEVVVIVGPSGAGKSTLLDLLAGLQPPTAGQFSLGGIPFSPFLSESFPARVGYVPQTIALLDDTVAFNIALEEIPDPTRLQQAVERASLGHLVRSLSNGLQTLLGEGGQGLSGGQRQRLGIARALYRNPALLILDEVTSALDEATASDVMRELLAMRNQVSLLFVTHDLRLMQADRIYKLDQGRLSAHESVASGRK